MPTLHHWCLYIQPLHLLHPATFCFYDNADFTSLVSFIQPPLYFGDNADFTSLVSFSHLLCSHFTSLVSYIQFFSSRDNADFTSLVLATFCFYDNADFTSLVSSSHLYILEIMPTSHHWCLTSSHLLFLEIMPTSHHWCLTSSLSVFWYNATLHHPATFRFWDNADFTSLVSFIQPLLVFGIMPTLHHWCLSSIPLDFGIMPTLHHWCLSSSH